MYKCMQNGFVGQHSPLRSGALIIHPYRHFNTGLTILLPSSELRITPTTSNSPIRAVRTRSQVAFLLSLLFKINQM